MFSISNFINLFFLSIPLVAGYNSVWSIIKSIRERKQYKTSTSVYLIHTIIALGAFLFALHYFNDIQT